MKHRIEHDLGVELAVVATKAACDSYSRKFAKYSPQVRWCSPTSAEIGFKVKLAKLSGIIDVSDTSVEVDLTVPLVLRVFREKAIKIIDTEVRSWIVKAKAGELS